MATGVERSLCANVRIIIIEYLAQANNLLRESVSIMATRVKKSKIIFLLARDTVATA